ncbi:MAG: DNA-processing protein DprA [Gorillibacterium sp.]|nr:DNA-processing protein DprA [Gorillibacterium sp.]
MDQRTTLLALQEMKGIGWKTILQLVAKCPELERLTDLTVAELINIGIQQTKAEIILEELNGKDWSQLEQGYKSKGIVCLTIWDQPYPTILRETSQPPWVLYCIGRTELMTQLGIAVVGTRNPTVYGRRAAEDIATFLSGAGATVISGLARGIDGAAHTGALTGSGGTIAIVGGGVDIVYPPENAGLRTQIASHGLILSEFPPGTRIIPGLFPLRNRIIAGLALATVVVEAAERSGSLITADQALDESRDVFAVPGPMNSPKSRGTNLLLRQGAKIVTEPADILREYEHITGININQAKLIKGPELTPDEQKIMNMLSHEPMTIDHLLMASQTNFGHLHEVLLSLTLKKSIKSLPGASYVKIESNC